jgi:hypothetical protein
MRAPQNRVLAERLLAFTRAEAAVAGEVPRQDAALPPAACQIPDAVLEMLEQPAVPVP